MLKLIHSTEVPEGKLPDMKAVAVDWAKFVQDYLPKEAGDKLVSLVEAVPHNDHMIHGDYHTKNLELQGDEVLLIDMDTLAVGDPVFEFASIYNAFIGFSELNHENVKEFQGFDFDMALLFWHKVLVEYFGTEDEAVLKDVEDKSRIVGYTRLIRRSIRRDGLNIPERKAEIDYWTEQLIKLLGEIDTLEFEAVGDDSTGDSSGELEIEASRENLPEVMNFVSRNLQAVNCPPKACMQIDIAVEEIFTNIANYAYAPDKGNAKVRVDVTEDPVTVTITFIDHGKPYDPLAKEDPDVTLSAEEREIGGLGIFMTKQVMDDVTYEYKDGSNILTLKKSL